MYQWAIHLAIHLDTLLVQILIHEYSSQGYTYTYM